MNDITGKNGPWSEERGFSGGWWPGTVVARTGKVRSGVSFGRCETDCGNYVDDDCTDGDANGPADGLQPEKGEMESPDEGNWVAAYARPCRTRPAGTVVGTGLRW